MWPFPGMPGLAARTLSPLPGGPRGSEPARDWRHLGRESSSSPREREASILAAPGPE